MISRIRKKKPFPNISANLFPINTHKTPPVKLICGLIFKEEKILAKAKALLEKKFGALDFESQILEFNYTDYYEKEFGKNLSRQFISFKKLIDPASLAKIKLFSNRLEKKLSRNNRRLINLDPGYLDLAKLVLATTKDYNHRIYLNSGIFAEITLFYQGKSFQHWKWTYPDYQTLQYKEIFNRMREIYFSQLK
ncbi:MAG: DUF4416 family protein [Candidatus Omnitrophica bacterium]|nr:DUF4416 family protein [Candidatus Omnitrophota bacterium]